MAAKETVMRFIAEYQKKINQLAGKIEACSGRIEELHLEIRYIHQKELPEAIEKRVLEDDNDHELKLKKTLTKYESELQEKQEELIVLQSILQKYRVSSADKVAEMNKLFRNEKQLKEYAAYSKMMYAKKQYVDAILKESKALRELLAIDIQVQEIEFYGGRRNGVYTDFTVNNAPIRNHLDRYNGIYLQMTKDEINRLIKGNFHPDELAYLNKFSHKKSL